MEEFFDKERLRRAWIPALPEAIRDDTSPCAVLPPVWGIYRPTIWLDFCRLLPHGGEHAAVPVDRSLASLTRRDQVSDAEPASFTFLKPRRSFPGGITYSRSFRPW